MSGFEASYIPAIVAAVGAGASAEASHDQAKTQRTILNRAMERTGEAQEKASDALVQEAQKYSPMARQQALDAQQQQAYEQSMKDLGPVANGIVATAGDAGAQSADFVKAKADSALQEGNRITEIAKELAKVRAPGQQLTEEGIRRAGVQGNISSLFSSTRNQANADALDAQSIEKPLYGTLGEVAQSVGGAMAAGGYGQPTGGAQYGLSGAKLGNTAGSPSFWGNTSRIRFGS